ncbi:MAG: hypothetical protein L0L63_04770 [Staphylococcus equorum]|uniref:hypothetical protein n=1 Tax=Staphylococcus TaxID=1279 RepID=UPI0025523ABC|nr:hypothetical protein [Staphylococcus equorum]MDN5830676.1 hypothetical protein [Tetragenococcus halophilus]MDN6599421.1 hypothetical protein [Tetragenococcus koreensis]MDK9870677.1 hypothetical protein [Staphylococcus equorum]MDK9876075.1 hypothetical protein [Staphylococcus equorum]MDN6570047.1 hypothetical protein [Staphylococcus equorum]
MKEFGWTLTEVREQPYLKLLAILKADDKQDEQQTKSKKEKEVIKGKGIIKLLNG